MNEKKNTHKEQKDIRDTLRYIFFTFLENEVSVIFHILSILLADDWLTKRLFSDHFTNLTPHRPFDSKIRSIFFSFCFFSFIHLHICMFRSNPLNRTATNSRRGRYQSSLEFIRKHTYERKNRMGNGNTPIFFCLCYCYINTVVGIRIDNGTEIFSSGLGVCVCFFCTIRMTEKNSSLSYFPSIVYGMKKIQVNPIAVTIAWK